MDGALTSRHLGLDLGGTYVKWVVLESDPLGTRTVATGKVATKAHGGPGGVVEFGKVIYVSGHGWSSGVETVENGIAREKFTQDGGVGLLVPFLLASWPEPLGRKILEVGQILGPLPAGQQRIGEW